MFTILATAQDCPLSIERYWEPLPSVSQMIKSASGSQFLFAMQVDTERFATDKQNGTGMSFGLYQKRIEVISQWIVGRLPPPICADISHIQLKTPCSLVGVLMKESDGERTGQKEDVLTLVDSKGQLRVSGIRGDRYVTGVVVGVFGVLESVANFVVANVYEPMFQTRKPVLTQNPLKVAFLSNMLLNSDDFDMATAEKVIEALNSDESIECLVILGSTLPRSEDSTAADWKFKLNITELGLLEVFESFLNRFKCKKLMIPGEFDPVPATIPQPELPKTFTEDVENLQAATNPASFRIENVHFICSSGDPVLDIVRDIGVSFHEAQLMLLNWRHLAPMPSERFEYLTFPEADLLVLDSVPDFFVCGHSDKPAWNEINGVNVISVPDFWRSRELLVLDTSTGDCTTLDFS